MTTFSINGQMDELDVRKSFEDNRVSKALRMLLVELLRAENLHPVWPENTLRQVAIMTGEAGEALQAALHYEEGRGSLQSIKDEIVQTGAMAIRALINLEG